MTEQQTHEPVPVPETTSAVNHGAQAGPSFVADVTPTQVRRPWRSTARTVFQALVGFAALAPLIAAAIEEATGYDLQGVPFVVVSLAVCAAVTRVMAIPAVEAFLRRFVPFLSAAPRSDA